MKHQNQKDNTQKEKLKRLELERDRITKEYIDGNYQIYGNYLDEQIEVIKTIYRESYNDKDDKHI